VSAPDRLRPPSNNAVNPLTPTAPSDDRPYRVTGTIDYRLARNMVLNEYRKGRLSRLDICDAHPQLLRAAVEIGEDSQEICPVCQQSGVKLVSYAFGYRLPPSGRCITSAAELAKLARSGRDLSCYVVEVCPSCWWNHLSKVFSVIAQPLGS